MHKLQLEISKGRVAAFVIGAVVAVLLIATRAALAFDDGVTIHACIDNKKRPRIVPSPDQCRDRERLLEWNIVGPQGPRGVPGEDGADGQVGAPGVLGFYTRDSIEVDLGSYAGFGGLMAECDAGDIATGGGYDSNASSDLFITDSYTGPSYHFLSGQNGGTAPIHIHASVVCADVTP